jgi:hypothetical protein
MKKTLKSIQKKHGMLNEAYAWERTSGGALPTLADVQAKYNAKSVNEQERQSLNEGIPFGPIQDMFDPEDPNNEITGNYKVIKKGKEIHLYLGRMAIDLETTVKQMQ